MKIIKLLIFFVSFSVIMNADIVKNFKRDFVINKNGSISVTEYIDYFFESEKHGIKRQLNYLNADGIENVEIWHNEHLTEYTKEKCSENECFEYKIGDAERYVSGNQSYKLKYIIKNAVRNNEDGTKGIPLQIYGYWKVPVERFEFSIRYEDNQNIYDGNENFLGFPENTFSENDGSEIKTIIESGLLNDNIIYSNLVINRDDIASYEPKNYKSQETIETSENNNNFLNYKRKTPEESKKEGRLFALIFGGSMMAALIYVLWCAGKENDTYDDYSDKNKSYSHNSYNNFYNNSNDYLSNYNYYSSSYYDDGSDDYSSYDSSSCDSSFYDSGGGGDSW